jgi:hypothetical protein
MARPVIDEVGNKYGMLTVVGRRVGFKPGTSRDAEWICVCACGGESLVRGSTLRQGFAKSCGCNGGHRAHNKSYHPAYIAYTSAKRRCNGSASPAYKDYGGRGIQFKFASFEQFWEELGPTWKEGLSIDRKDNNGHYEPGNCRWATREEQGRNKRNNVTVMFNGNVVTVNDLAKVTSIKPRSCYYMYKKYGSNFNDWPTLRS